MRQRPTPLNLPQVSSELESDLRKKMTAIAEGLLACFILDPQKLESAKRWVGAKKFSGTDFKLLADAVFEADAIKGYLDLVTVCAILDRAERRQGVEAKNKTTKDLLSFARSVDMTAFDLENYSLALCDYYKQFSEIKASSVAISAMMRGESAETAQSLSQREREDSGAYDIITDNEDELDEFDEYIESKFLGVPERGIRPHLASLRKFIPIHAPGELVVIAARPGVGKTQYVIDSLRFYESEGLSGVMFSLEMKSKSLYSRLVQRMTGVNLRYTPNLTQHFLLDEDRENFMKSVKSLRLMNFSIDTTSHKLSQICYRLRQLKREKKISYCFLDYLQLITADGGYSQNREQEIAQITRTLKLLANELEITIFVLAQLNRATESNAGKEPTLSNLRESGAVEQDADLVIFIHRPEIFGITEDSEGRTLLGRAKFIIAKQREGALGFAWTDYDNLLGFSDDDETLRTFEMANVTYPANSITDPSTARPASNVEPFFEAIKTNPERMDPSEVPF